MSASCQVPQALGALSGSKSGTCSAASMARRRSISARSWERPATCFNAMRCGIEATRTAVPPIVTTTRLRTGRKLTIGSSMMSTVGACSWSPEAEYLHAAARASRQLRGIGRPGDRPAHRTVARRGQRADGVGGGVSGQVDDDPRRPSTVDSVQQERQAAHDDEPHPCGDEQANSPMKSTGMSHCRCANDVTPARSTGSATGSARSGDQQPHAARVRAAPATTQVRAPASSNSSLPSARRRRSRRHGGGSSSSAWVRYLRQWGGGLRTFFSCRSLARRPAS